MEPQREFWDIEREEHGFIDLFDHFAEISLHYEMPVYDVDVILLKADYVWPYQPHDYYWQRHISRKMVIVPVPGDHHTMVIQPSVTKLWERLKPLLDRFDSA
jgi:thioesterase domain-containing protein